MLPAEVPDAMNMVLSESLMPAPPVQLSLVSDAVQDASTCIAHAVHVPLILIIANGGSVSRV
jgi:hypothetical protein